TELVEGVRSSEDGDGPWVEEAFHADARRRPVVPKAGGVQHRRGGHDGRPPARRQRVGSVLSSTGALLSARSRPGIDGGMLAARGWAKEPAMSNRMVLVCGGHELSRARARGEDRAPQDIPSLLRSGGRTA